MKWLLLSLTTALAVVSGLAQAAKTEPVKVVPSETDELLANPGIGWETAQRTSKQDKNLPSWIPSTVHYSRWGWKDLEPKPGVLNTEFLDKVLKETREVGQKLGFRVMCCSSSKDHPYHPGWLKEVGGRELIADYNGVAPLPIPDLDDPVTLDLHLDFIKRLGQRYDGHPHINHVDLGSMGWWGEWHLSGSKNCKLPTVENRIKVVDAYLAAFKKTPMMIPIGNRGEPCLKYATAHGVGWRADCLGDMGGFSKTWYHMRDCYPVRVKEAGIQDVWKTAPVAWETCWDMRRWVREGWSLRYIFNYALAYHGSLFNNKSQPLPEGEHVRPELERFLRRLGYRLVLRELAHPPRAQAGSNLRLSMKWQNVGSAPCYRPYRLAYRLTAPNKSNWVFVSAVAVNRWLPGSVELFTEEFLKEPKELPPGPIYTVDDNVPLPAKLLPGQYTLSVAIVDGDAALPVVRLAIKGRADDGWYPLSQLQVTRP